MLARVIILLLWNTTAAIACSRVDMRCTIPNQTRTIDGTQVHKDCWQYRYRLNCDSNFKNDCNKISAENCNLVEEKCINIDPKTNICINYERAFACEYRREYTDEKLELLKDGEKDNGKGLLCSKMCFDGSCVEKMQSQDNNEMINSVSLLNSLKDAKKGLQGDALVNIFSGRKEHCAKKLTSYTNCCKMSGWGKILGAGCSPESENLAKKRKEKKCVEVGTYCHSKLPFGICGIKHTVFCCYDSVLVKIINQEAKRQLGRNNGTPENPQCGGLQLEDLERVDFSMVDFSEAFNTDILPKLQIPTVNEDFVVKRAQDIETLSKTLPDENKGFSEKVIKERGM